MTSAYVTTRHRCDFCSKSYAAKGKAAKHESGCWKNPATRGCPTCAHFTPGRWPEGETCAVGIGVYQSAPVGPDEFDCCMEWQRDCIGWCPT